MIDDVMGETLTCTCRSCPIGFEGDDIVSHGGGACGRPFAGFRVKDRTYRRCFCEICAVAWLSHGAFVPEVEG